MRLSKPAMISAFFCPGMGQWAAGHRILGALIVSSTVTAVMSPFLRFLWSVMHPNDCDFLEVGLLACNIRVAGEAWRATLPVLKVAVPTLAVLWIGAVLHANRLTLPGKPADPE